MGKVTSGIDWDLLGRSTLTWWPGVVDRYGALGSTKPLYRAFRDMIERDLRESDRVKVRGREGVLGEIV